MTAPSFAMAFAAHRVLDRGIRLRAVLSGAGEVNVEAVVERHERRSDDDPVDERSVDRGECRHADDDIEAARRCARIIPRVTGGRQIGASSGADQ
ncbi:hypothetical protein BH11MYX2_BH11MYX2_33600 [soil metagenome]